MKSILKNSNGNAVSTGGKLFTVSANYTDQIKQALIDKGVATEDTPTSELVSKIESISLLKKLLDSTESCSYLFYGYTGESVDHLIKYDDTENVTKMNNMCYGCEKLISIPPLNTNKVVTFSSAFRGCYLLKKIDISSMDALTSTSNTNEMANYCFSLTKVIIRTMTTIPPLNVSAFYNCHHFAGTKNSTYNPEGLKDGRIYVPDDKVEELKQATNWSEYADIIVPLSTLVED